MTLSNMNIQNNFLSLQKYFNRTLTRVMESITTITEKIFAKRFISKTYKQLIKHNATIITLRTICENARALYFE